MKERQAYAPVRYLSNLHMALLRLLTGFIWRERQTDGSGKAPVALIQISHAPFYVLAGGAERRLVYSEAVIAIMQQASGKYLVSVRDENKADRTTSFPVDQSLSFTVNPDGNMRLATAADPDEVYVAATGGVANKNTLETFKLVLAQCLYESAHKRPHTEASDDELDALITAMAPDSTAADSVPLGEEIYRSAGCCSLYLFNKERGTFAPVAADVTAVVHRVSAYSYTLHIGSTAEGKLHSQFIDKDITDHVDKGTCSFVWCFWNGKGQVATFCLRWAEPKDLDAFASTFGRCLWEAKNREAFCKVKDEDSSYLLHRYQPMEIDEMAGDEGEGPQREPRYISTEDLHSSSSGETEQDDDEEVGLGSRAGHGEADLAARNQHLAIGYKHNRNFVSRGSSIGVFKATAGDDNELEFVTNIKGVQSLDGRQFAPEQMMLHGQDSSLLLRSARLDSHKVYRMDLERGKVVDEWTVHPDTSVTHLVPLQRNAQTTAEQCVIGINENSVFRLDPRLPGSKRVDSAMKQYAAKNEFSCGTTTGTGELAVASKKGEIRLYDKLDKRAKSLIPGFGDAILGVDVLDSGDFIVATCKTYLLVVDTEVEGESKNAFFKSAGARRRPPIRLQLRPEHVAYIGDQVSFTPAHFGAGRTIVTSTGPYVVIWPLSRITKGALYDYQIRKYSDTVIADDFQFGQDDSIVVTLPHHVTVTDRGSLVRPTAKSF